MGERERRALYEREKKRDEGGGGVGHRWWVRVKEMEGVCVKI
jgi:hypothetical protein